jgi:hypothetical protein
MVLPDGAHAKSNCRRPHHRHSKGDRITEPQVASTRRHAVPPFTGVGHRILRESPTTMLWDSGYQW